MIDKIVYATDEFGIPDYSGISTGATALAVFVGAVVLVMAGFMAYKFWKHRDELGKK